MTATPALARASLAGTLQLLTLCFCGGLLSHLSVLTRPVCAKWSSAIYRLFLPTLLFVSLLRVLYHPPDLMSGLPDAVSESSALSASAMTASGSAPTSRVTLLLPSVWAVVALASSTLFAAIIVRLVVSPSRPAPVRRVAFVAVLLGNANNLPLLLLQALCDNHPSLVADPTCPARAAGYVAMFVAVWNSFMWTVVLSFVTTPTSEPARQQLPVPQGALDRSLSSPSTTTPLLSPASSSTTVAPSSQGPGPVPPPPPKQSILERILSPPVVAMLAALLVSLLPGAPALMLDAAGPLAPICQALDLLAGMAVPSSSLIVGARLHAHMQKSRRRAATEHEMTAPASGSTIANGTGTSGDDGVGPQGPAPRLTECGDDAQKPAHAIGYGAGRGDVESQLTVSAGGSGARESDGCLSGTELAALVCARYVALPLAGRVLVGAVLQLVPVHDGLLRVYLMMPFFMPTASNSVVMVHMAAERDAEAGDAMEQALVSLMFWQYAVAPLFLTANMALSLVTVMPEVAV